MLDGHFRLRYFSRNTAPSCALMQLVEASFNRINIALCWNKILINTNFIQLFKAQ